ncbi:hypothetical protein VP01_2938g1 [Puccinia sorghi]|uniref:Uncharacterized protein n=1 Tax=Puccinia sorghi TaxID=27349 RepID=A0A0L6V159_9BASI|nr:hypothetical protein VP01_2938g1 [Puccinia sorghi]
MGNVAQLGNTDALQDEFPWLQLSQMISKDHNFILIKQSVEPNQNAMRLAEISSPIRISISFYFDYLAIIEWLKIKRNHNSCFGTGKAQPPARISTINEKLEIMCPHYHTMNDLMGVLILSTLNWPKFDAQADNETASSNSEPAGNEIRSSEMESNNDYVFISTSFINIKYWRKAEENLADENNKSDEGKGNQEESQPSGEMNKQGSPANINDSTAFILDKEKNASSTENLTSKET